MKLAGKKCKPFFKNMSHIFCFAHLLHNVIGELVSHYKNTNFLIVSIKASVVKNNTRKTIFSDIGQSPEPILTRWGSWFKTVFYYSDHFCEAKYIVLDYIEGEKIVENAKEAVSRPGIMNELVELKWKYQVIHDILILAEKKSLNVSQTYSRICEINIHDDKFGILAYIKRRLAGTDVTTLMEGQMDWISPSDTIL